MNTKQDLTEKRKKMEELLGLGSFDMERTIPGKRRVEGREFCYVSDNGQEDFETLLDKILDYISPPIPKSGGMMSNGCKLTLPNGEIYQAISYKGDIEGWRLQIEEGAKALNVKLARINEESIVLSDGQSFYLEDCKVEFY